MEDDFDIGAAVDGIGEGLGFGEVEESDDLELEVTTSEESSPVEPVVAEEVPTEPETPSAETTPDPAATAPRTWRKEAAATWAALPSEAKNEILKREQEIFQGIETYKADASYGRTFKQAISRFEPILLAQGLDPAATVGGLLNAHHQLATGSSAVKLNLLRELAKDYGIDLIAAAEGAPIPPYIDPAVAGLQSELEAVKSRLQAEDRRIHQQKVQTISTDVAKFQADPKNVYFNEVSDEIVSLINQGKTLQDAYDTAIWMNPATRAKEQARQSAESAQALREATVIRTKAAKASVAANVTARAKSGSAATPLGSLDDTLNEAFASISSRG